MKSVVFADLDRQAKAEFGGEFPKDFANVIEFVSKKIATSASDDEVALCLDWVVDVGLNRGDREYLRALELAWEIFPDAISASALANALSHIAGREAEAAMWSDRAIREARTLGRLVRYALAARIRLMVRIGRLDEAIESLRQLIRTGPKTSEEDDISLPRDIADIRMLRESADKYVKTYLAMLK